MGEQSKGSNRESDMMESGMCILRVIVRDASWRSESTSELASQRGRKLRDETSGTTGITREMHC